MPNTIEAYINRKPLNPNRDLPHRTLAQAQAEGLTSSNRLWVRTDGQNTPILAEQVSYSNTSVAGVLDLSTLTSKSTISSDTTTAKIDISDFTWDMFSPLLAIITTRVANNKTANLCIFINVSGTLAYKNIGDAYVTGISLSGNELTVTMPTYANIFIIGKRKTV